MLKKVISESKSLGNLNSDSARLLYTWLIPFLDVEGRHSADPEIIKGHVFPKVKIMTVAKIGKLLPELALEGLIILYRNDGESYLQLTKFHEHQKLDPAKEGKSKIPAPKSEDIENKATPDNFRVTPEKSSLSKVKLSKDKFNNKGRIQNEFDPLFERLWAEWPREGRFKKKHCRTKFMALCKSGKIEEFRSATQGYSDFLKAKKERENFSQQPMHLATWLNNWEEDKEQYIGFEYRPPD